MKNHLSEQLAKIDALKTIINKYAESSVEDRRRIRDYFRTDVIYTNLALEGNTLTFGEMRALMEDGLAAGRKSFQDHLAVAGHHEAWNFITEIAGSAGECTEDIIRGIHFLLSFHFDRNRAGYLRCESPLHSRESKPKKLDEEAERIPALLAEYLFSLNEMKEEVHPVLLAVFAHRGLSVIRPFADRNGLTARILLNYILFSHGLCPVSIAEKQRDRYLAAAESAEQTEGGENMAFSLLVAELELDAQQEYCRTLGIPLP